MSEDNVDINMDSDADASDGDDITVQEVLSIIQESWINEKFAPELLPHKNDLIECLLSQLQHMEENMKKLKKHDFKLIVHQMEIDRIRFLISSYLRIRLEKIETFIIPIMNAEKYRIEHNESQYLSPDEYKFATEFLANQEQLFRFMVLRPMPGNLSNFDAEEMSVKPNLNSYVFIKAKANVDGIIIEGTEADGDEEVSMDRGSQHIMPYKPVADLIKKGDLQLI